MKTRVEKTRVGYKSLELDVIINEKFYISFLKNNEIQFNERAEL